MWRRPEVAVLMVAVACKRDAPPPPAQAVDASAPAAPTVEDAAASASPDASSEASTAPSAPRHARKLKSIGHTSVVFKIEQTDGAKIVWKPDSRIGRGRYKGEIAAYRLAQLLGIDNVPPALPLAFDRQELARAAEGDDKATKLLAEQVVFEGTTVRGAFTEWIDDYAVLPLENDKEWRGWLKKGATIPDDKRELARAVSTLVLFDFVTGNWDRWSGANVATSKGKVLYVDNDAAFFEAPPKDGLERNQRLLEGIDRFSRSVVERLRALGDEEIARALSVLSRKAIEGVLARRAAALGIVAAKELSFD